MLVKMDAEDDVHYLDCVYDLKRKTVKSRRLYEVSEE